MPRRTSSGPNASNRQSVLWPITRRTHDDSSGAARRICSRGCGDTGMLSEVISRPSGAAASRSKAPGAMTACVKTA